jgi:hypothetical protein
MFAFGMVICFAGGEAMATTISIDPLRTFLFTNNDPDSGHGSVPYSIPIALGDLGISGGEFIQLERLGAFYDGTYGYGAGINTLSLQTSTEMIGVFSSNNALMAPNVLNRVPGALDAGIPLVTWNTLYGNLSTDIPQDFRIANTIVQVPLGANYLFVAAQDIYYSDNSDPDRDYGVRITPVASVPEPATLLLLSPVLITLVLLSRKRLSQ